MHFWSVLPCCIHHVRYICISKLCYLFVFIMWGIYAFLNCVTLLYSSCQVYMHMYIYKLYICPFQVPDLSYTRLNNHRTVPYKLIDDLLTCVPLLFAFSYISSNQFILTWSETTACCGKFLVLRSTLFPTTVSWPDYSYHSSVERFWWFPVDITDKHKHFLLLSCCNITGCCRARSCKCTYIRVRSFSHFFWSSER